MLAQQRERLIRACIQSDGEYLCKSNEGNMAGFNTSGITEYRCANLPNIFRQRQQDAIALQAQQAKQKKKMKKQHNRHNYPYNYRIEKGELEQSQVASSMGAEGRKAVDQYTTSRNIRNLPISREYGQPLSDIERAEKYSLPTCTYEPSAKVLWNRLIKQVQVKQEHLVFMAQGLCIMQIQTQFLSLYKVLKMHIVTTE